MALDPGSPGEVTHWELLMEVIEKQPAVFKKNGVKCSVLWFDGGVLQASPTWPTSHRPLLPARESLPFPRGCGGRGPRSQQQKGARRVYSVTAGTWDSWAIGFLPSTCIGSMYLVLWEPATVGQYQGQLPMVPKH